MSRKPSRSGRGKARPAWQWWTLVLIAAALNAAIVAVILDYGPRLFRGSPIEPGQIAPAFALDSTTGERVDLADYPGRHVVLLIFFPGYR